SVPEPKNTTIGQTKTPKSFAQAVTNLCDFPLSQLPQPVFKGDGLAIEILEVAYQAGLEACKHNLHGRVLWPKGSTPLSVVALKAKLSVIRKDLSQWGIISLGKGFFEFTFSALEDVRRVRSIPSWNLNPGMLKLFAWSKDFNPKMQHNTSAHVIGHHFDNCKRWNKEEVVKGNKDINTKKKTIVEPKKVYVPTNEGRPQQSKPIEVINVEKEVINVEGLMNIEIDFLLLEPMEDFQSWTDAYHLFHLPTRGAEFTWNNGRGGLRHTEKKLDRVVCNQSWLDLCCVSSVTSLIKHKSDHFPLVLEFQLTTSSFASHFKFLRMWSLHLDCRNIIFDCWNTEIIGCPMFILSKKLKILKDKLKIWNTESFGNVHALVNNAEHKLQHIQEQIQQNGHSDTLLADEKLASNEYEEALNKQEAFWQEKDSLLAEEVIPNLVTDDVNALLTMLPSHDEIKAAAFALNKDRAPGPDGFGAFFYQHYWDVVKIDVINAMMEFFTSSWILPGFNSNIIALLPKTPEASSIDQYRTIAMANFKFKVISKIIADRLASIMPVIISDEQKGFIHDRNIKDCLCIVLEAANLLHNKSFGGNLALKIDITKAFDTLDWNFLLKVLKTFGFNEVFCNWIHVILQSAYLSVSINGKSHDYFSCSRGVRQGDPLSPLLFCLAEDVLSRGNLSGLKALKDLFDNYALESGQVINTSKSTIFSGSITLGRLNLIVQLLNFNLGSIPFNYLGVPIFKGKPKTCHLQPVADKIKLKLSAWKASLLSIAGRVQLVRAVVQNMLTYSISLYSWPVGLLKDIEKCIRNFIWSGDIDKRKLVLPLGRKFADLTPKVV
ncbi:RNA-directed DNA polymerase (Reverse transcriptase), partial [Trifolium medium]|nr:RNA-directed DNA polymerase (Reverse transcriptase) [Trifolium medium]